MAEEEASDNPFEETPAPDRLNAPPPGLPTETAVVAPPSYSDAVQPSSPRGFLVNTVPRNGRGQPPARRTGRGSLSTDETAHLLPTPRQRRKKPKGAAKAFLLLLGIGQWYSGVCIFISFALFSVGLVAVILSLLSFVNFEVLMTAKIITIVSGVLFILISILWPCSWVWDQFSRKTGCSYTPLLWYSWLLSLIYFGVIGALGISFAEHYDCVRYCEKTHCPANPTETDNFCVYVRVPFVVLAVMVALALGFILVSCICCTGMSCEREAQTTVEE